MLKTLTQLWNILSPLDKSKLLLVLVLVVIMACIEAAGVVSIMPFLAVLANPHIIESNAILQKIFTALKPRSSEQFIVYLGFISLSIVVLSTIVKITTQYALNRFSSLQRHYFSTRLLKIYLQQNYSFFIERNSSVLVKNILAEVDNLIWTIILPALTLISYSVVVFAMITILLAYNPLMALITAVVLSVFYSAIYWFVRRKLSEIGKSFMEANTERYKSCQEALSGIKDVIINDASQGYIDNFEYYSRIFAQHIATRDTLGQIPLYVIETVGYGCLIILAIVLTLSGGDVANILPVLGLYGFAAYRMLPAAQNIYRAITEIKFAQPIFNILKPEFDLHIQHSEMVNNISKFTFKNELCIGDVSFSYSNSKNDNVLTDVNFTILKNTSVGIVGKSGSGKSTLMDILLGLLIPQKGRITIDGKDLNLNNSREWQKIVGYVPQSIYLADKTIAENIAFGISRNIIDMEQVVRVAKQAQIHDFIITSLPQAYDTMVGERGMILSGGQRQRIGIARALYKDPDVLFMDEATSALDIETEHAVNQAIQSLSGKKTMVIIAHRESAVAHCDKILKLN